MCLIIVKQKGLEMPLKKDLKGGMDYNDDGAGFMYVRNGIVNIKKGYFSFKKFYKALKKENIKIDEPCVIHFRLATHGLTNRSNCHPFPISKNVDHLKSTNIKCYYGMAHNGILPITEKHGLSDTMLFILNILSYIPKNTLFGEEIEEVFKDYIKSSKICFLDYKGNIKIWNEKDWIKKEGILFSNDSFQRQKIVVYDYHQLDSYQYMKFNWNNKENKWKDYKKYYEVQNENKNDTCPKCLEVLVETQDSYFCPGCGLEKMKGEPNYYYGY